MRRFNPALQSGRPPARETLDGALVLGGGALLPTPGFLSDILGVLLCCRRPAPLVRRSSCGASRRAWSASADRRRGATQAYDVEGSAVDVEPDGLDRGRR